MLIDIRDNDNIYVGCGSATPSFLLNKLLETKANNVKVYQLLPFGNLNYLKNTNVSHISLFNSNVNRKYINKNKNFMPVHFSQIPKLIKSKKISINVVFLEVSEEDENGFHSLGMSVECLPSAIDVAERIIVCVNKNVPKTIGYRIHKDKITQFFQSNNLLNLYEESNHLRTEEKEVADRVAEIIPSGSTIQTGVGSIPSLVLNRLHNKENLSLHTECLFDSAIGLLESQVAKNAICTLALGGNNLVKYINENKKVQFMPVEFVNDPNIIASKNIYAINSAISVDFLGQACSDSIGKDIYSGFGGIVDFMRGASYGDGLSILALTSKTKCGKLKFLKKISSPVTLTRADVDVIITENGLVDLRGTTIKQRSYLIKKVAGIK